MKSRLGGSWGDWGILRDELAVCFCQRSSVIKERMVLKYYCVKAGLATSVEALHRRA